MSSSTHPRQFFNPVIIYTAALITALLWPLALPGFLGLRDMMVIDHPALSPSALGFGNTPARNAPQDGFLALAGTIMPASWFARLLIVGTAILAAILASKWGRTPWTKAAAITVTLYNPYTIERLLQGHWSLVMAAWLLPAIAYVSSTKAKAALVGLSSLTPTGLILATITALATSRLKLTHLTALASCSALLALPWLIPSLISQPHSYGTDAFTARAETFVGTLGALVGLGGIWNADAVPPSRHHGFAIAGIVLFVLLLRWMPPRLAALAFAGLAVTLALTYGPTQWLTNTIPGLALFRDSHKLIILMLPAMVAAAGRATISAKNSHLIPAAVMALCFLQAPDAPHTLGQLTPHTTAQPWRDLGGLTLNADSKGLAVINNTPMVDPWSKATELLSAGSLTVDGQTIDPPNENYTTALTAWQEQDTATLLNMGVTSVISDGQIHQLTPTPHNSTHTLGLTLTLTWIATVLALVINALRRRKL